MVCQVVTAIAPANYGLRDLRIRRGDALNVPHCVAVDIIQSSIIVLQMAGRS